MLIALLCLVPLAQTRIIEFGFRSSNKVQIAFFFVFVAVFLCRDYFRLEVLGAVVTTTLVAFILSAVRHLGVLAPIHIGVPFVAVFVSMLFGRRAALWCFGLTCVAIAATGILHLTGDLNYLLEPRQYAHSWTSWLILVCTEVAFGLFYLFLIVPINEAERRAAERTEAVLQGINDALLIHNKDTGAILQVNQKMCAMWGYSSDEVLKCEIGDLSAGEPPYAHADARAWMDKASKLGPQLFEWQAKDSQGRPFWVEVNMRKARLGDVERLLVIARDIGERKRAEVAMARQQAFETLTTNLLSKLGDDSNSSLDDVVSEGLGELGRFMQAQLAYIVLAHDEGTAYSVAYEWCGPSAPSIRQQMKNLPRGSSPWAEEQILTGQIVALTKLDDLPAEAEDSRKRWEARGIRSLLQVPFRGRGKSSLLGGLNLVSTTHEISWQPSDVQQVAILADSLANAIERKQSAELLRESEERYKALFERSLDLVYINDLEGRFIDANDAALNRLGYERRELQHLLLADLLSEEQVDATSKNVQEILQTGAQTTVTEFCLRHKDGSLVYVETKGSAIYSRGKCTAIQSVARDITGRKLLEEQLRQAQKMEAIGSLAGGVAHDFNNLLSVILNCTEFALSEIGQDHPARNDLLEVERTTERAASLTRQLLAFSRKQVMQPVSLNLNAIALGLEKMLRRVIGENIEFAQKLEPNLGVVTADPGQLEQVIMNLVVNARDAMPLGGTLTIQTANVEVDALSAAHSVAILPGSYVRLTVSDSGFGMDAPTKARIFEPFFTTKEKGRGTGLGLSTVYGIVKQSGGNIRVHSAPNQGTTFNIYLPKVESAETKVLIARRTMPKRGCRTETVLLVEDEDALRNVAQRALESAGYTVISAADGFDALRLSAQHPGEIQLLLTDVILPGMGGKELSERLVASRPAMRVLFVSGYTDDAIVSHGVLTAGLQFLGKPFTATQLVEKAEEVLHRVSFAPPVERF